MPKRTYTDRVNDYMNDPFFPSNRRNPFHWVRAAFFAIFNH